MQEEIGPIAADTLKGRALYAGSCQSCHGKNGAGNDVMKAPALANTDTWYVYQQLQNFRKGIRGYSSADTLGAQMAIVAKAMPDTMAIADVTAYISTFSATPSMRKPSGDLRRGEITYQGICGSCHGPNARGNVKLHAPRLNGMQEWYLKAQIVKYRNTLRGNNPADKFGSQMAAMANLLTDEQAIDDVIAYIITAPSKSAQ